MRRSLKNQVSRLERIQSAAIITLAATAFVLLLDPFGLLYPLQLRPKQPEEVEPLSVYKTRWEPSDELINIHLVPHTHDDAGWQVSVDEYQLSQVDVILDNVLVQLEQNPDRRFTYAETNFFASWFRRQPLATQSRVKKLVEQGRLEIVNGGWVQHDEAGPLYNEMIDQTTRGHLWLKKHLNVCPSVGWQLDPFGHSNTQAWLMSHKVGLNSMFFGRTDYRELQMRYANSSLEYLWQSSKTFGPTSKIFAVQVYGQGKYGGYYSWFPFEETNAHERNYVQDDLTMQDYNVPQWVDKIVAAGRHQASQTRTSHQMWMLGNDFTFQSASRWFTNYDKLINYVNLDGRVRMFYSTPETYIKAKLAEGKDLDWNIRTSDMFPLGDGPHEYWTGYFTSRPSLKRQYRYTSAFLGATRQLETLMKIQYPKMKIRPANDTTWRTPTSSFGKGWTDDLEGALAVIAHHDGITGTARQSVTNDYAFRLALGSFRAENGALQSLETITGIIPGGSSAFCNCNSGIKDCMMNMSTCSFTSSRKEFTVVVWNPLTTERKGIAEIPVRGLMYQITREDKTHEKLAVLAEIDALTKSLPLLYLNEFGLSPTQVWEESLKLQNPATHKLTFPVVVPPLGYSVYRVSSAGPFVEHITTSSETVDEEDLIVDGVFIGNLENEKYKVEVDRLHHHVVAIVDKESGHRFPFTIEWGYYRSSVGGCTKEKPEPDACYSQASGAYLFRPNETDLHWQSIKPNRTRLRRIGTLGMELHQQYTEWISHTIRVMAFSESVEVEWTVGPIPIDDDWGKEVIVRYRTNAIKSEKRFFTDSNGREMIERIRDYRSSDFCVGRECKKSLKYEQASSNYYPVNSIISISDDSKEFSVVVDATHGGTSLKDGEIELMVHRRVLVDDWRGVEEPLNETMCGCGDINALPGRMGAHGHLGDGGCGCVGLAVRGKHQLILGEIPRAKQLRRKIANEVANPLQFAFFENDIKPESIRPMLNVSSILKPSATAAVLSDSVHLLTLCSNYENGTLVRLTHQFEKNEHPALGVTARVSLKNLFQFKIKSVAEYSLSANQPLSKVQDRQKDLPWFNASDLAQSPLATSLVKSSGDEYIVELRPMDVVTFWVQFEEKK